MKRLTAALALLLALALPFTLDAASFRQNSDGSVSVFSDAEGKDVARWGGPSAATATQPLYRGAKNAVLAVAGGTDTGGGIVSWQPPEVVAGRIVAIKRALIVVSTVSTGANTISLGVAATATGLSNNLIDGKDANASVGLFDNVTDGGSLGKARQRMGPGNYLTLSTKTGASAGLVGKLIIEYVDE